MIEITDLQDRLPPDWQPKSDPQRAFLDSPADVLLFGGSAGGLKSESVLVDAAAMYDSPGYHAVIFRRTFPELQQLMDRSKELYSNLGATFNISEKIWRWDWGSTVEFKYLEKDDDIYKRQGFEFTASYFDESTHFLEKQVRYIIQSRMRSKHGLRLKVRLATNPGNRGAPWHKKVFLGPKCPHCILKAGGKFPKTSRKPYQLYTDASWMDGVPLGLSTMFIPSKVTDHSIFGVAGGSYAKRLRGLPLAFQQALLEGCWDAFEGQYFDCFDYNCHTMKHQNIEKLMKPWWPKWVSIDYGFAHATVAYLWTMDPEGHVYTLSEYIIHRRKATDVALDLQKLWGDNRIKAWYLSPDAFRHDGTDDFSRAEMMSRATGIGFDEAYNERISGAMLMYQLLQDFKWHISDSCELLIASIPSRIHDEEKKAEDVLKVDSEDEDDAYDSCLVSSTYIQTSQGPLPIVDVKPGMLVETRQGLKPVLHSWKTGHKPCYDVAFSNGVMLTGTRNHPVWTPEKGFVRLDSLRYGDTILAWQAQKLSSSKVSNSGATQIRHIAALESTSILAEPTASGVCKPFIKRFGRLITGLSQRAMMSITRTTTHSTMNPLTLWPSSNLSTSVSMAGSEALTQSTWPGLGLSLWHGIGLQKVGNGTQCIAKRHMPNARPQSLTAAAAGAYSILSTDSKSLDSALTPVSQPSGVPQVWTTLKRYVKAVLQLLRPTSTRRLDFAPGTVLSVRDAGSHDVYNLEVEGANEYFANGILVHNCRYGLASHINPGKRPDSEELQAKITSDEPTTAMMQYNMAMAAMAKKQRPLFYRRGARSR